MASFDLDAGMRWRIKRLLESIPYVTDVKLAGTFWSSNDIRLTFNFHEIGFYIEEPYGDNSQYVVYPSDPLKGRERIPELEKYFREFRPKGFLAYLDYILGPVLWFWFLFGAEFLLLGLKKTHPELYSFGLILSPLPPVFLAWSKWKARISLKMSVLLLTIWLLFFYMVLA